MARLGKALVLIVLFAVPLTAFGEISESQVRQLVDKLDNAVRAQDVNTLGALLSSNVQIRVNIKGPNGKQLWTPTRAEYLQHMAKGWAAVSDYNYQRSNIRIAVEGDGATVSGDITESMVIQGQRVVSHAREAAAIRLIDGELLIVGVVGEVNL